MKIKAPDLDAGIRQYEQYIKELEPEVLIIDSLSELGQDDLTKEHVARELMGWARKLVRNYGTSVVFIHHNRKATEGNSKPKKLSDLYGSYIFGKLSETVISLYAPDGKDYLELDTLKARFGKKESFRIKRTEHLTFELVKADIQIVDSKPRTNSGSSNPLLENLKFS